MRSRLGSGFRPESPRFGRVATLVVTASALASIAWALAVPDPPPRFLHDETGKLRAAERRQLEDRLQALRAKGLEIGVLMMPSLRGESLEDYTLRVAEAWKPGSAERDDGALIAVFLAEHKIRLEIGYGLEPHVPDAAAGRIIRNLIAPEFRRGDYAAGLRKGIDAIAALADGQTLPPANDSTPIAAWLPFVLVLALFVFFVYLRIRYPSVWIAGNGWGTGGSVGRSGGGWTFGGGGGGWSGGGGGFGGGSFGGGGASGGW
ncbi:MAG: TPM domain-containing protein [bacterium]